ncbi:hypothetical protein [Paenibacillus solanacearum]|uniref:hypothetical protein n=1 Tax=Paenibacillus solanacearum TaxID=2048548 RepID=UPI001C404698|nr:hypothetical protein [Paenibacillus solanacearum]
MDWTDGAGTEGYIALDLNGIFTFCRDYHSINPLPEEEWKAVAAELCYGFVSDEWSIGKKSLRYGIRGFQPGSKSGKKSRKLYYHYNLMQWRKRFLQAKQNENAKRANGLVTGTVVK